MSNAKRKTLVRELVGGEPYDYYPLGKHVVSAPGVCRGRPTFKYTRIEVAGVLECLAAGHSVKKLVAGSDGRVPAEAIREAAMLATRALTRDVSKRAVAR